MQHNVLGHNILTVNRPCRGVPFPLGNNSFQVTYRDIGLDNNTASLFQKNNTDVASYLKSIPSPNPLACRAELPSTRPYRVPRSLWKQLLKGCFILSSIELPYRVILCFVPPFIHYRPHRLLRLK